MPPWLAPFTDWAGLATLIAAIAAIYKTRAELAGLNNQFHPPGEDSLRDEIQSIKHTVEKNDDNITSLDHRLGHEIGEIRDDMRQIHEDHAARIRRLEQAS